MERKRKEAHDVQLAVHGSKHQRRHVESIVGLQVDQARGTAVTIASTTCSSRQSR